MSLELRLGWVFRLELVWMLVLWAGLDVMFRWWVVLWVGVAVTVLGAVRRVVVRFLVVWCIVWVSVRMEGPVH